jgi:hypothetical protein
VVGNVKLICKATAQNMYNVKYRLKLFENRALKGELGSKREEVIGG